MCQASFVSKENLRVQVELYGEPLAERFGRIMAAFHLTQGGLAKVLGISPPMLSQLMSGQRIKIGNPAVYERVVMLEQSDPSGDPDATLQLIHESRPVLSTTQTNLAVDSQDAVHRAIAATAPPAYLRELSESVKARSPQLARLLFDAAGLNPSYGDGGQGDASDGQEKKGKPTQGPPNS